MPNKQFGISVHKAKEIVHGYRMSLKNLIEASEDVLQLMNNFDLIIGDQVCDELNKLRTAVNNAKLAFKK